LALEESVSKVAELVCRQHGKPRIHDWVRRFATGVPEALCPQAYRMLAGSRPTNGGIGMLCTDVMKSAVRCVSPQVTIEDAAAIMRDEGVGFLPVVDRGHHVIGTLTDRDIAIRVVACRESGGQPIEKFMTREVVACRPSDDLDYAQQLMSEQKVG